MEIEDGTQKEIEGDEIRCGVIEKWEEKEKG